MKPAQKVPEEEENQAQAPKVLPEPVPFDPAKFPFNTTHPELQEQIKAIIANEETPIKERVEGLTEEKHALYVKGVELQEKLQESINNPNWKLLENEDNLKGYFMKGDDIFLHAKGITTVNATPIEVYAFLQMHKYRKEYDTIYVTGKDIEVFPANFKIVYWRYKGKSFVADRDLVVLLHTAYQEDGSIFVAAGSIEDSRAPPTKDPLRAISLVIFS